MKSYGVDVSMTKLAKFVIKMLSFKVFRTEITDSWHSTKIHNLNTQYLSNAHIASLTYINVYTQIATLLRRRSILTFIKVNALHVCNN